MPKRNEIYGFEVIQAMRTRKRQSRVSIARTILGYLGIIGLGFALGLMIMWMQGRI